MHQSCKTHMITRKLLVGISSEGMSCFMEGWGEKVAWRDVQARHRGGGGGGCGDGEMVEGSAHVKAGGGVAPGTRDWFQKVVTAIRSTTCPRRATGPIHRGMNTRNLFGARKNL